VPPAEVVVDDDDDAPPHALRRSISTATREKDIVRKRGLGFMGIFSSYYKNRNELEGLGHPL
jgi:hypothetical protein